MNKTIRFALFSLFLCFCMTALSQSRDSGLLGKVLDENGEPLPGALVASADAKRGAMTDVNGEFTM